ncbi:hypothetical protein SETIT_3G156000v2 [Setaria italica]|uniref:Uncharacterized protein n=2 Tax=Setaria TaxID=4554 RepID=K3ZAW0_SETIT|nr:hypothetical protein SETIT_3G156000v2 [Setaria italica]TKW26022.1 hypothetical protein SEVIR_3G159100v2 [Setaria viridis]
MSMADPAPNTSLIMLLGASAVVVFSVAGEAPVHAGFALAGFLLWLLGVARLLLLGRIGDGLRRPLFMGALVPAAANLAVDKLKHFVFGRQDPAEPAPARPFDLPDRHGEMRPLR